MAFVVTAVTGLQKEPPKKSISDTTDAPVQGDNSTTENSEESTSTEAQPTDLTKVRPGVAFWIAVQTHECMLRQLEGMFVNMFLACGFSVYHCKVSQFTW